MYANNGALKSLGYTLDELKNLTIFDINPDITLDNIDIFRQYLLTISPELTNLSTHKRKDGSIYPVQASVHKLTYQGQTAVVIFDTDITELTGIQNKLDRKSVV